jgi:hypothetical protein
LKAKQQDFFLHFLEKASAQIKIDVQGFVEGEFSLAPYLTGEFDPGSERTLAACLTHASRARKGASAPEYSGERVRNT